MYIVLSGAKKNAGDFLITARAIALLRHVHPDHEFTILPGWESLEPHIETLRGARAVIIPGGPGYQRSLYPDVYKLLSPLSRIPVPIVPLGVGWKAFPGDDVSARHYAFTDAALEALWLMAERGPGLGCRDVQTLQILHRVGLPGVLTGCPVWYDLKHLNVARAAPEKLERIAYTPPQMPFYREQSLAVARFLRARFPQAMLFGAFHRGIDESDGQISPGAVSHNGIIARELTGLGFEIVNVSGGVEKLDFYDGCDLHVGYRVHAHIFFASHRLPSVLLHEDGRGRAQTETLGTPGLDAFSRPLWSRILAEASFRGRRPQAVGIEPAPDVVERLDGLLRGEQESGFARARRAGLFIDRQFDVMRRFIEALP